MKRNLPVLMLVLLGSVALIASSGALNGGTPLTASAFDGIVTTIKGMLSSSLTVAMALIALFAAVWQITHGKGYGFLSLVLGTLACAIVGPTVVTSIATATRPALATQHAAVPQLVTQRVS